MTQIPQGMTTLKGKHRNAAKIKRQQIATQRHSEH